MAPLRSAQPQNIRCTKGELVRSYRRTFPASLSLHKGLSRESIQSAMRQDEPRHILGYLAGINDRRAEEVMVQGRRKNPEGQGNGTDIAGL